MARPTLLSRMPLSSLAILDIALRELASGRFVPDRPSFASIQAAYAAMSQVTATKFPQHRWEIPDSDPVSRLWSTGSRPPENPESVFLSQSLRYLREPSGEDLLFAQLFWQVVRVRTLFYRHIVQRPMTPGLQWFVRTYARISAGRKPIGTGALVELAAATCGLGRGLRSLEVRTTPDHQSALLQFVKACDESFAAHVASLATGLDHHSGQYLAISKGIKLKIIDESASYVSLHKVFGSCLAGLMIKALATPGAKPGPWSATCHERPEPETSRHVDVEFGIVLHFAKERSEGAMAGRPKPGWQDSNADPDPRGKYNGSGYRYSHYYRRKRQEAESVAWLLKRFPQSLAIIRGVDVCTDELAVPTWVIKPLYDHLREVGQRVSAHLGNSLSGGRIPPLRFTAHAGEDFVHLLGGLRRVAESIDRLGLREGDRIGHGVALGVDAGRWAASAGRLALTLEDRLFDLAWEWDCYSRLGVPCATGRLVTIERQIGELGQEIFAPDGAPPTPHEIVELTDDLHDSAATQTRRLSRRPATGSQT